jgi:hypothetical protein
VQATEIVKGEACARWRVLLLGAVGSPEQRAGNHRSPGASKPALVWQSEVYAVLPVGVLLRIREIVGFLAKGLPEWTLPLW